LYTDGMGFTQNHKEAARWFSKAAEGGNAKAQQKLGLMQITGDVVPFGRVRPGSAKLQSRGDGNA